MARLRSTLSTVAHRSPMLLTGSVSGRPHSKWWWCHDIGCPLLAAEHSLFKALWSGTPCRTTSAHSRTMSPLDSAWKPGFSLATSVLSALETSWQLRYIYSHLPLSLPLPFWYCFKPAYFLQSVHSFFNWDISDNWNGVDFYKLPFPKFSCKLTFCKRPSYRGTFR